MVVALDEVRVELAAGDSAPTLFNLLELYLHDMSEIFPIEVNGQGRFGYDKLSLYWSEPDSHWPFLIRYGDRIAGFALVTLGSPAAAHPEELDLAEFFVLRSYRRAGVGRRAAVLLWNELPGQWVVRVAEANRAGLPFWETTIGEYTGGAFTRKQHPGRLRSFQFYSFRSPAGCPFP
jgi:predicted acetyltransferase